MDLNKSKMKGLNKSSLTSLGSPLPKTANELSAYIFSYTYNTSTAPWGGMEIGNAELRQECFSSKSERTRPKKPSYKLEPTVPYITE